MAATLPSAWRDSGIGVLPAELQRVFATSTLMTILCATVLRIFHCWQSITCAARRANMARFPRNCTLEALQALMGYDWPGNVNELKATLERVVLTTPRGNHRGGTSPTSRDRTGGGL